LSTNKEFSDTSAGRYSLALYELAEELNCVNEVEIHSNALVKLISENKDFSSLIKDPTSYQNDQLKVISKISEIFNLNNLLFKFLSFLISKRRFFFVEKILKDFIDTCSKKRGEVKAELISAKKLSDNEIDNIKNELSKNFTSKIKLNYKHDENLIGGLIVKIGSIMVDTSIKNKLRQIENRMIEA
tara:strand:+ start:2980 stop:3537 length:558 start_codon:yes stop_codon:yes gene_type:complete